MQLGIFSKTFARDSLEENLDAVRDFGFTATQYNLVCAGLPTLPDTIPCRLPKAIAAAHRSRDLEVAALSGTFNIIDHNPLRLSDNLRRFRQLAQVCSRLETNLVTICTGTNDPNDMWKWHPDNESAESWDRMLESLDQMLTIAEESDISIAFEPEYNNVVSSAAQARKLLDELSSPRLKVVLDVANLLPEDNLSSMRQSIDEALDLLAPEMAICHLKEIPPVGSQNPVPIGTGLLDFDYLLAGLGKAGFTGPLIMHGLEEQHVMESRGVVARMLAAYSYTYTQMGSTDAVL